MGRTTRCCKNQWVALCVSNNGSHQGCADTTNSKCNLVSGHGLCGQQRGLDMNWVDQPRTSADERDVVCSPRCRDCVWAVQGLVVFS